MSEKSNPTTMIGSMKNANKDCDRKVQRISRHQFQLAHTNKIEFSKTLETIMDPQNRFVAINGYEKNCCAFAMDSEASSHTDHLNMACFHGEKSGGTRTQALACSRIDIKRKQSRATGVIRTTGWLSK